MKAEPIIDRPPPVPNKTVSAKAILNFVLFFSVLLHCGVYGVTLTSIEPDIYYAYGYSKSTIIMTSSALLLGGVSISLFNAAIIEAIGTRWALLVAATCLATGSWCRLLLASQIRVVLASFVVAGFGGGFALNMILKFCHEWFPASKRPFYYSFLTLGTLIGCGLGPILPYAFISEGPETSAEQTQAQIMRYLWTMTGVASAQFALVLLFGRSNGAANSAQAPPSSRRLEIVRVDEDCPPEAHTLSQTRPRTCSFCRMLWKDTRGLFGDTHFLKLLFLITVTKGNFLLTSSIMVIILDNLNYAKLYGSVTIVAGLGAGLLGSVWYSRKFSPLPNQRYYLSGFLCLALVLLSSSLMLLYLGLIWVFIAVYMLSCLFSYPMIPMYFSVASESQFESSISSVNAYMMMCPQVSTILLQFVSSACFEWFGADGSYAILTLVLGLYFASLVCLRYLKTK